MAVGGIRGPVEVTERSPVGFDIWRRIAHAPPAGAWRCHPPSSLGAWFPAPRDEATSHIHRPGVLQAA
jgi:hypothetical protein